MFSETDVLNLRFAHSNKKLSFIRYSDFPPNMPSTWYHICEQIELRLFTRRNSLTPTKTDSGFVAIHETQWPLYQQWWSSHPLHHHEKGLFSSHKWYTWLKLNIISPFFKFDSTHVNVVLFRLQKDQRVKLYNDLFGSKWIYSFQQLYSQYEQNRDYNKTMTTTPTKKRKLEMNEPTTSTTMLDDDDAKVIAQFIESECRSSTTTVEVTSCSPDENENTEYRASYITAQFSFKRFMRQRNFDRLEEESVTRGTINEEKGNGRVKTNLAVDGQVVYCKKMLHSVNGILSRERIELNLQNYQRYLSIYDLSKFVLHEDSTHDGKQYVLIRDMSIENEKSKP